MIKISNICLHQNLIVIKFFKILKIREIFCENPRIIFVLFYDVQKENMFTTSKASIIIKHNSKSLITQLFSLHFNSCAFMHGMRKNF